jgi:hypothetical protein
MRQYARKVKATIPQATVLIRTKNLIKVQGTTHSGAIKAPNRGKESRKMVR